jgi:putative peptide zinc metalloprotease protein
MDTTLLPNVKYAPETRLLVPPFEQRPDGDDVIIANHTRSSFLSVPGEAAELLTLFAAGHTVEQVRTIYYTRYGLYPDLDDFIDTLAQEGFVQLPGTDAPPAGAPAQAAAGRTRQYHFEGISRQAAARLCSRPVLAACGLLIALAVGLCAADPSLIPPSTVMVVDHQQLAFASAVLVFCMVTVFLHELAHLVAARAAGVSSRIGLGTRLWILVAETDMTGIWLASRRQRIVAFLAGPLLDLTSAAGLVVVLHLERQHWFALSPGVILLLRMCLFVYLSRLLWQLFFFVPTDVYYVVGAVFGCKNLMHDTEELLLNALARLVGRTPVADQSDVPAAEMRVVRWFALVWLAGRGLAFASLLLLTLPVLAGYGELLVRGVAGDRAPLVSGPLLPLIAVAVQAIGIVWWMKSSLRLRRMFR